MNLILAIKIFDKTTAAFLPKSVNKRLHPFNIRLKTVKTDKAQKVSDSIFNFLVVVGLVIFASWPLLNKTRMVKEKDKNIIQTIITGPSYGFTDNFPKREMWKEIANELNGECKIKYDPGYGLEIHNISIPYKKWTIKISVSDTRPLKFQISFSSSQDFELILSLEDFIDRIIKKFSKPEIELGWKEFDKHYLIKSNRSDFVRTTITNEIQKSLLKHNVYSISYQTDSSTRTAELISVIQRRAGNKEMIFELIEMYKLLIDNLEKSRIIK